jgi:hypothetical protein
MPAEYLHGAETIEITSGPKKVRGAKTAVIGIVGTAPVHLLAAGDQTVNELIQSLSDVADRRYAGPVLASYSLPRALQQIRDNGGGTVLLVNVFDPAEHKTDVAAADLDITAGQIQLTNPDITAVVVKAAGGAGSALVEGTDYTVERLTGLITIITGGALDAATEANVGYSYGNPAAVDAADIIGEVDGGGNRTGSQAFLDGVAKYGYHPKILIAPSYSQQTAVVAALQVIAQQTKTRAVVLVDAPVGTTFEDVLEGRGSGGSINFNVSDQRVALCWPHVKVYDKATNADVLAPFSASLAGVICLTDVERGFHKSPSNRLVRGITGLEYPVQASINDPQCEANQLNAAGVVTIFNAYGSGYRVWGNRSSAFPASSSPLQFVQSRRVADQVHESLELAMLDYMDEPLDDVVIKAVLAAGNAYVRDLIRRRALPQGSQVVFQSAKNPPEELSAGHATFDLSYVPIPPFERATFESFPIDISLLANLVR